MGFWARGHVKQYLSELRQLTQLALPLVFTQLAQMGMSVADTIMAGRVSAADQALLEGLVCDDIFSKG